MQTTDGSDTAAVRWQKRQAEGIEVKVEEEQSKDTETNEIPNRGTYRIKAAVYGANGSDDSFWVKVNDGPAGGYLWDTSQNTGYQQDYVNDRHGADPVEVLLAAGENTVTAYLREDGTRLDEIKLEPIDTPY